MKRQTFELLILGCSSASPTAGRHPSSQLLNIAERHFLIDCGEGTQMQLRRFSEKFQRISHIFISHMHGDHFFGVPGLISSMHLLGRQQELTICCPAELKEIVDLVNRIGETRLRFRINWIFTDSKKKQLLYEDSKVEVFSFPLRHRLPCCGFLFREKPLPRKIDKNKLKSLDISFADIMRLKAGLDVENSRGELIRNREATLDPLPPRTYAYCSDTAYDMRTAEFAKGADLLYHESTFLEEHAARAAATFHSTAKQAAEIAVLAGVKKLLLGHYSARYPELSGFLTEAGAVFSDCLLATDGKKIEI